MEGLQAYGGYGGPPPGGGGYGPPPGGGGGYGGPPGGGGYGPPPGAPPGGFGGPPQGPPGGPPGWGPPPGGPPGGFGGPPGYGPPGGNWGAPPGGFGPPGPGFGGYGSPPPDLQSQVNTWFILSIVSIFCCLLGGIFATINASKAKNALASGNWVEAQSKLSSAKTWAIISMVIGILGTIGQIAARN